MVKNSSSSSGGKLFGLAEAEICISFLVLPWRRLFCAHFTMEPYSQHGRATLPQAKANQTDITPVTTEWSEHPDLYSGATLVWERCLQLYGVEVGTQELNFKKTV